MRFFFGQSLDNKFNGSIKKTYDFKFEGTKLS